MSPLSILVAHQNCVLVFSNTQEGADAERRFETAFPSDAQASRYCDSLNLNPNLQTRVYQLHRAALLWTTNPSEGALLAAPSDGCDVAWGGHAAPDGNAVAARLSGRIKHGLHRDLLARTPPVE